MRALVPALLVVVGLAGPAVAAPHIPSYSAFSGPKLMGNDVVWVAASAKRTARVEVSRRGTGPVRQLARLPNAGPRIWLGHARLHASAAGWAVDYNGYVDGYYESPTVMAEVIAAAPGGPVTRVARCEVRDDEPNSLGAAALAPSGRTRILARGARLTGGFDFDGERLVLSAGLPRRALRFTVHLDRRMRVAAPPRCTRVTPRAVQPVRRGRVRFRFDCSGFAPGDPECLGRITLRTPGGRLLRLNALGRRLLRRSGRLGATVTVRAKDILDRRERRSGRLVLREARQ